eukprot:196638-Chlamydomonas_euryale.AAC.1
MHWAARCCTASPQPQQGVGSVWGAPRYSAYGCRACYVVCPSLWGTARYSAYGCRAYCVVCPSLWGATQYSAHGCWAHVDPHAHFVVWFVHVSSMAHSPQLRPHSVPRGVFVAAPVLVLWRQPMFAHFCR